MTLVFVDVHGFFGEIRDDLTLTYNGPGEVEKTIKDILTEIDQEVDATEDQFESLLLELGKLEPVRAVQRSDADPYPAGSRPGDSMLDTRDTP